MCGRKFQACFTDLKDVWLHAAKQEGRRTASKQGDLLADTSLEISVFKKYIKGLPDCNDFSSRMTTMRIKDNGLHRVLVRGYSAKKDWYCTLYCKDVTEMLSKQIEFCGKQDITFRPDKKSKLSRVISSTITTEEILTCHDEIRKKAMRSQNIGRCLEREG